MAAGRTASTRYDNGRIGVIREGRFKCRRGVTVITLHGSRRMARRVGIGVRTHRDNAIVACRTGLGDRGVIERAVR